MALRGSSSTTRITRGRLCTHSVRATKSIRSRSVTHSAWDPWELEEGENYAIVDRLQREAVFHGSQSVSKIDGVRAEYADGFGLARSSNTTPVIVLRFEADTPAGLVRIQDDFRRVLTAIKPDAPLPY